MAYIAGETSFPVQISIERNIPLIIWPYHQATEQVGMHSHEECAEMMSRYRIDYDLVGYSEKDL